MPPLAASRFVPPDNAQDASYFAASAKRRSLVASFSSTAVLYMFFAWRTTHALQCGSTACGQHGHRATANLAVGQPMRSNRAPSPRSQAIALSMWGVSLVTSDQNRFP